MGINTKPPIHSFIIAVNVFVKKDDKLILLRRSSNKLLAPSVVHPFGGKVELGEDIYTAAIREVKEESGVNVKNIELQAIVTEYWTNEANWLVFYFVADYENGDIISSAEGIAVLLTQEEFNKQELFPTMKLLLPCILNNYTGLVVATVNYDESKNIVSNKINILTK